MYDYESGAYLPVYTLEKADGSDPYEIFLSGPKSLLRIENPNAQVERKLLVFRDSFAASLLPLLAEGYSEITLADNALPCRFRQGRVQAKYSTAVFFMQEKVAALS